ncbi:hypothetical protein OHA37_39210 [Streptomyces sp. NBC_00335]|uniref:hypothetical protein n=1 Tax=unclassified Streptomyces TaxID=2593676 RepID=UPI002259BF98|nr:MULTISPECIES: hypothetical protein [unclassified Streptomyces]MCX5409862.1 hypothetical protein [Streptomyces sp. NBC_00086]
MEYTTDTVAAGRELAAIRMLTDYDMDSTTPFAVWLVGQPTLRKRMKHGVLAALDQRIWISYQMPTMSREETSTRTAITETHATE